MGVRQEFITLLQNLGVDSLSACEALGTASVFTVEVRFLSTTSQLYCITYFGLRLSQELCTYEKILGQLRSQHLA